MAAGHFTAWLPWLVAVHDDMVFTRFPSTPCVPLLHLQEEDLLQQEEEGLRRVLRSGSSIKRFKPSLAAVLGASNLGPAPQRRMRVIGVSLTLLPPLLQQLLLLLQHPPPPNLHPGTRLPAHPSFAFIFRVRAQLGSTAGQHTEALS